MSDVRAIKVESEFTVHAPREKVFAAFCHEQHEWYPHTYGGDRVRAIVLEPRVGGQTFEDWGDSTVIKDRMVTFGEISDEMAEGIRLHGDLARYEDHLRSWVEKGTKLGG